MYDPAKPLYPSCCFYPVCVPQLQVWKATVYLTPLIGAYLADALIGRFWVILVFSCIYFLVSQECMVASVRLGRLLYR
jgi:hypothetical protein